MENAVPDWAIDVVEHRKKALSKCIAIEVMKDDHELCDFLRDIHAELTDRLAELETDSRKIDVYEEFYFLCTTVGDEMLSSWKSIIQNEMRLTTVAASVALSAAVLQAMVVGMVISVLGTAAIRTQRYLLPSSHALSAKAEHAHRVELLSKALSSSSDLRFTALAIEQLGLQKYQTLMDRGQRMLSREN